MVKKDIVVEEMGIKNNRYAHLKKAMREIAGQSERGGKDRRIRYASIGDVTSKLPNYIIYPGEGTSEENGVFYAPPKDSRHFLGVGDI